MLMKTLRCAAILSLCSRLFSATNPHFDQALGEIRKALDSDRAMEIMRTVYSTDRYFTFPRFEQTSAYLKGEMERLNLHNVEIVGAPADGVHQTGFWTAPLAWDAKAARLEILDDSLSAGGPHSGRLQQESRLTRNVERSDPAWRCHRGNRRASPRVTSPQFRNAIFAES